MAKNKLYSEKEKKIEEKEENKMRKKKKERGEVVGEGIRNKKKHGRVSSVSVYFKSLDFPWNLSF